MKAKVILEGKSISPPPGTPVASSLDSRYGGGRKGKILGVPVWLKGISPTCEKLNYDRSPYYERAAYIISEMLGLNLVPPTILYLLEGEVVSAMKWMTRAEAAWDRAEETDPQWKLRLDVFDYLIGNTDRHCGNWLITKTGRVWAIDNAYAFNFASYDNGRGYGDEFDLRKGSKLPTKIVLKMRQTVENPDYFRSQLNGLIDKEIIEAILKRMEKIVKKIEKGGAE